MKESETVSIIRIEALQREITNLKSNLNNSVMSGPLLTASSSSQSSTSQSSQPTMYDSAKLIAAKQSLESKLSEQTRFSQELEQRLTGEITKLTAQLAEARSTIYNFEGCTNKEVEALRQGWINEKRGLEDMIVGLEMRLERAVFAVAAENDKNVGGVKKNGVKAKNGGVVYHGNGGGGNGGSGLKKIKMGPGVMDEAAYIRALKDRVLVLEMERDRLKLLVDKKSGELQAEVSVFLSFFKILFKHILCLLVD